MTNHKPWNRSSAWSPDVIAHLNSAAERGIQLAIKYFQEQVDVTEFTDEQRAEVYRLLVSGVLDKFAAFEVSLRPHHAAVETALQQ